MVTPPHFGAPLRRPVAPPKASAPPTPTSAFPAFGSDDMDSSTEGPSGDVLNEGLVHCVAAACNPAGALEASSGVLARGLSYWRYLHVLLHPGRGERKREGCFFS
eukprot:6699792-Pyramimonas_sp.AAC.1